MIPDLSSQGFNVLPRGGVSTAAKKGAYVAFGEGANSGMVQIVVVGKALGNPIVYQARLRAAGVPARFVGRSELATQRGEPRPRYKFWSLIFKMEQGKTA